MELREDVENEELAFLKGLVEFAAKHGHDSPEDIQRFLGGFRGEILGESVASWKFRAMIEYVLKRAEDADKSL